MDEDDDDDVLRPDYLYLRHDCVHLCPVAEASSLVIELDNAQVIARLREHASSLQMLNVSDDSNKTIRRYRRHCPSVASTTPPPKKKLTGLMYIPGDRAPP